MMIRMILSSLVDSRIVVDSSFRHQISYESAHVGRLKYRDGDGGSGHSEFDRL